MTVSSPEVVNALRRLEGQVCWNVSAGGAAASSFSLALGDRIPRKRELRNPEASDEYRRFEGAHTFLVWCSWRLDGPDDSLVSSDNSTERITSTLRSSLEGLRPLRTTVRTRAHDVELEFERGLTLHVFCDRAQGDASSGDNWQLESPDGIIAVGPGFLINRESRG